MTEPNVPAAGSKHHLPAPGLAEAAAIRWDAAGIPTIAWDDGTRYDLVHPTDPSQSIVLVRFAAAPDDPQAVAEALAETLAACDFPPTDGHAAPGRVAAALRASRVAHPDPVRPAD